MASLDTAMLESTHRNTGREEDGAQVLARAAGAEELWLRPASRCFRDVPGGNGDIAVFRPRHTTEREDFREIVSSGTRLALANLERPCNRYIWDQLLYGKKPTGNKLLLYVYIQRL